MKSKVFWIGKAKKILTEVQNKEKKIRLSPVEILVLTQLRARQLRSIQEGEDVEDLGQYGYEMIQELNDLFSGAWKAKSGTIYPMLSRLESKKGMIVGERKKSPLGPVKKVYKLTEGGKKAIDRVISDTFENNIDVMLNYINLMIPFLQKFEDVDPDRADELFQKIMMVPTKFFNLSIDQTVTQYDENVKNKKLKQLKLNLQTVIRNIDEELKA